MYRVPQQKFIIRPQQLRILLKLSFLFSFVVSMVFGTIIWLLITFNPRSISAFSDTELLGALILCVITSVINTMFWFIIYSKLKNRILFFILIPVLSVLSFLMTILLFVFFSMLFRYQAIVISIYDFQYTLKAIISGLILEEPFIDTIKSYILVTSSIIPMLLVDSPINKKHLNRD